MGMERIVAGDGLSASADVVAENVEALRGAFPEAFTEDGIDFDVLRQLLGGGIAEGDEKYGLNWHGKRDARRIALTPSTGTLRPCPDESVDWDTTQNLMIEGDNLEVLKLLQKSYSGKVKLIYIDPPYNTGNDFVYKDDYQDNIRNYLELTGQADSEGKKLSTNVETSGRFHTDWLNMMYPRLKLARNLLQDDGVIFISIDDNELENLLALSNEIFGEENHLANFSWEKRTNRENRKAISSRHDHIVCFLRDRGALESAIRKLPMSGEALERYKNPDDDPRGRWKSDPATAQAGHGTSGQFYTLVGPDGRTHELQSGRCWLYTEDVMQQAITDGRIWFGKRGTGVPRVKTYLNDKDRGLVPESIWFASEASTNERAKNELKALFDQKAVFDTPKPVELIEHMIEIAGSEGVVMDFFAGSGATAHALLNEKAASGGEGRRYILVQLPSPLDSENVDQRIATDFCDTHGLERNLAELTKERLRRAGVQVQEEHSDWDGDLGFRVFKLDSSNIRAWSADAGDVEESLLASLEHVVDDRTDEDLQFEVLLKLGLDLCVPTAEREFAGVEVSSVGGGVLMSCLSESLSTDQVETVGTGIVEWIAELTPAGDVTVVFRDSAFESDVTKTNMAAILEQGGVTTVRSI